MGTKCRKTRETRKEAKDSPSPLAQEALPAEPLHSLSTFNWILLAFTLLYDAFFALDLAARALFCPTSTSCFSHSEVLTLGLLFGVNLLSTAAIACFLLAVNGGGGESSRRNTYFHWGLLSLYLLLNGLALCLQLIGLLLAFFFAEFQWTSLAVAVFVLLYEVTFTGGSLLVYRLVWMHALHHQQDYTIDGEQSSPSPSSSPKDKTPPERQTAAIRALCDSMAASGKQAATAMEHFVESMRLNLPGRLSTISTISKPPGSSPVENSISSNPRTE